VAATTSICQLVFENNIDRYAPAVHDCPHVAARDTRERPANVLPHCTYSSSSRSGVDRRHKFRTDRRAEHGLLQFHQRGFPHMLQRRRCHQCLQKNCSPAGHLPATCQRPTGSNKSDRRRSPRRKPLAAARFSSSERGGPPHVSMALSPVPANTSPVGVGWRWPSPNHELRLRAGRWLVIDPPCNASWIDLR
jgi:hypothetical protein